ncbi:MAG: alpha-E domain-containing protein [Coriobacteriia bacterium]|nr:alpha-E domain-containing protein [Coriobacteriia bacterium]
MGTFTLSKTNRLYWLGRYVERAYLAIELMEGAYDTSIDGEPFDFADYCERLNIPADYEGADDFLTKYTFSPKDPNSAATALSRAFDNAIVLRETLGSMTLSYMQMAMNVMGNAGISMAPMLDLQDIRDSLMAFKGCVDDYISDENSRQIIKLGSTVERIDMCLRLEYKLEELPFQFERLSNRIRSSNMRRDGKYLRLLLDLTPSPNPAENKDILLECIENLFPDA